MTVSSETNRNTYSGTGSLKVFSYTFRILSDDEILVQLKDSNGTVTTKTKTTDYTVSGVGDASGGAITFVTAPAATDTVIFIRNVDLIQSTDFTENSALPAETLEEGLDRLTMIAQQQQEELDRSVKVDSGVASFDGTLPSPVANKVIGFNSSADGLSIVTVGDLGDITISGSTANGVYTYVDDSTLGVESNLTFDGSDLAVTGNIAVSGTVDGRDVSIDGTKLDGIETSADVTDEANVVSSLSGATLSTATVAAGDKVLVQDADDSDNLKTATAQSIANLATSGTYELIATATASSSATISFTDLSSTYFAYDIVMDGVSPATDNVDFYFRTSSNNGSSYDGMFGDYQATITGIEGNGVEFHYSTLAQDIRLGGLTASGDLSNATDERFFGTIRIINPSGSTYTAVTGTVGWVDEGGDVCSGHIYGFRESTTAVNAVQFFMESGNIAAGTFKLYGLRAS